MMKVKELKGMTFNVPLSDSTALYLSGGQSKTIKEELVSPSLLSAEKSGLVSITKVKEFVPASKKDKEDKNREEKTTKEKSGGAK
jgi:hypothetical protein